MMYMRHYARCMRSRTLASLWVAAVMSASALFLREQLDYGFSIAIAAGLAAALLWRMYVSWLHRYRKITLDRLKKGLVSHEATMQSAAEAYAPDSPTQIADPASSVIKMLSRLPGVVRVDVSVQSDSPAYRIIHFRDMHLTPLETIAFEQRQFSSRPLTQKELELEYEERLVSTEMHQIDQMAALRCLIRHHGLRTVLLEGLCEDNVDQFHQDVAELRTAKERNCIEHTSGVNPYDSLGIGRSAQPLWMDPGSMWIEARLGLGACGRLQVCDELEVILPLDAAEELEASFPTTNHSINWNAEHKRHQRHVQKCMASGAVSVIILGGWHDLSDAIKEQGNIGIEYVRITTQFYGGWN